MRRLYADRRDAGRRLATLLEEYSGKSGVVVLGLARGGVAVAFEVAHALGVPLDVFAARKLGVPHHEELAMGAIATGGVCVLNENLIRDLGISWPDVERVRAVEWIELQRRELLYRGDRPPLDVHGLTVILVDDGLATGVTMQASVTALRAEHPRKIVVAVPVGSREGCAKARVTADECICAARPTPFPSVGAWYDDFAQVGDDEVRALLETAALHLPEDARDRALAARLGVAVPEGAR